MDVEEENKRIRELNARSFTKDDYIRLAWIIIAVILFLIAMTHGSSNTGSQLEWWDVSDYPF